jgi:hypothetical protein
VELNQNRFFRDHYQVVAHFDVTAHWTKYEPILGEPYLMSDSVFFVFKKEG